MNSGSEVRTTKNVEWWRSAAYHIWRTYFALKRDGVPPEQMTDAQKYICSMCDKVLSSQFVSVDQDILRTYFTSHWGDDLYVVEDYSIKHNVPVRVIWIVIRRASRLIMEETKLLEKKGDGKNE